MTVPAPCRSSWSANLPGVLALAAALAITAWLAPRARAAQSPSPSPSPAPAPAPAPARPLKVFILAGQSNMQGHAKVRTFRSMAGDPRLEPLRAQMQGPDGTPTVCRQTWISSIGCLGDAYSDLQEQTGLLTAGFGAFGAEGANIGPEFTFGLTMEQALQQPILIIKTAWGGRNLHTDFRPPSAGEEEISDFLRERWKERGLDAEKEAATMRENGGVYYRHMISHVRRVLRDIPRVVPGYDPAQGYELAGFVWFQGFNDLVDGWAYPEHDKPGGFDRYADLLCHLIRDVRRDLDAPEMPFVIGVMGIGGDAEGRRGAQRHFRAAQMKPASLEEFQGSVVAVQTAAFWDQDLGNLKERMEKVEASLDREAEKGATRTPQEQHTAREEAVRKAFSAAELQRLEEGVSNGGYHYLGAARIMAPIGRAFAEALLPRPAGGPWKAELAGYLLVPHAQVDARFDGGFSMYVAAWPLQRHYPGQDFQSGLFGTWMFPHWEGAKPEHAYTDVEGGLGWWRDTRFATETPKFIMGGVALNFSEWANGPGAGKGRDWSNPLGHYAIAQLSPWVLWPPDGLNLKQGTCGGLLGYGYLPLPLVAPSANAGGGVPTGGNCWTLFLNSGNFKGPVAFFLPRFWSRAGAERPDLAGRGLDAAGADPNRAVQMETQHIPAFVSRDSRGDLYARVAPTLFPAAAGGDAPLVHRITSYSKAALWDAVQAWFAGGPEAPGRIDPGAAALHAFTGGGGATWEIRPEEAAGAAKAPLAWDAFAAPVAFDDATYGYRWQKDQVTEERDRVTLPQYYRLTKRGGRHSRWMVVRPEEVPAETGLSAVEFPRRQGTERDPYLTPDEPGSCWRKPGPVAGPFQARLGDGSVVTYSWYRFADQPALLNAGLSDAEREEVQRRVERLHRVWTREREYLPPPTTGTLADLDPALLVTPPIGLEAGYVPIVTRQEAP
ncbi:MAG: sialate O-acetylesterase [Phycisphaerales bacterium]